MPMDVPIVISTTRNEVDHWSHAVIPNYLVFLTLKLYLANGAGPNEMMYNTISHLDFNRHTAARDDHI